MKKIALSASFYNIPTVAALLRTCDIIYTSNLDAVKRLRELFGPHVYFVFNVQSNEVQDKIVAGHPDAEVVRFSQLFDLDTEWKQQKHDDVIKVERRWFGIARDQFEYVAVLYRGGGIDRNVGNGATPKAAIEDAHLWMTERNLDYPIEHEAELKDNTERDY